MINLLKGIIIAMFIAIGGLLINSEPTFYVYTGGLVVGIGIVLIAIAGTDIL